jgi:hypothetical protein
MGFLDTAGKVLSPAYAFSQMGKGKNPANAAMPYLNQIAPMAQQNLGPWAQQGQQQAQQNQNTYSQMVSDPAAFHAQLRATYSPSEGYNFKRDNYLKAASGAAAAGGQRGSQADQEAQQRLVQGLLAEDEGQYLDYLYKNLQTGLQGNELGANRGLNASSDLTNVLGSTLGTQGQLAYRGQENKNMEKQNIIKLLAQLGFTAAGAAAGGPAGAQIGSQIGSSFGGGGNPSNSTQFGYGLGGR